MTHPNDSECSAPARGNWFTTTHWSLVLNARDASSPRATEALEKLCRTYWYPLYAYLRREGKDKETAEDLTQGFFARLLEKNYLGQAQRDQGKFRSFLLASLKHFLADESDKARALKRGGGKSLISLDDGNSDERYRLEPVDAMDAGKLFERRWALTLLEQARERLKEEYFKRGKAALYERLRVIETGDPDAPLYAEIAAEMGMTVQAVKNAVFALRRRHRELVREEVAHTVSHPDEVDEEIRHLITIISK